MTYKDCFSCGAHVMTLQRPDSDPPQHVLIGHAQPHPEGHLAPGNIGPWCTEGSGALVTTDTDP